MNTSIADIMYTAPLHMTKGAVVLGGLWGLRSISQNTTEKQLGVFKEVSLITDQVNLINIKCACISSREYTARIGMKCLEGLSFSDKLLSHNIVECSSAQLSDREKQAKAIISDVTVKKCETNENNTCEGEKICVLLHDADSSRGSLILKGLHITFSWTMFATMWSSMIVLPIVAIWKSFEGAWSTVATVVCSYVCSWSFQFPSSHELRRFLVSGLHKWFPHVDIVYEEEPPVDKTIFCCHPHGVFGVGTAMLLDDLNYRQLENGLRRSVAIVTAPFLRWCNPVFKFLSDIAGIPVHGAGKNEFRKLLESGQSFILVPGGFSEATITCVGKERIYIHGRKGFIKYALRAGCSVTPVYVFGESDLYHNPQGMMKQRLSLNNFRFQIPGVLPYGYPLAPLLPRRIPLRIVCGKPMELPLISNPTEDDVNHYHAKYVAAIEELYCRHVDSYHDDMSSKYGVEKEARPIELW